MPHKDSEVRKAYFKKYNANRNKAETNERFIRARYGIGYAQRDILLAEQGGCDICGRIEPDGRGWCIDHDHACCPGKKTCGRCIRGVLCFTCNSGLGQFRDDPDLLYKAIEYLTKSKDVLQDANPSYRRIPSA